MRVAVLLVVALTLCAPPPAQARSEAKARAWVSSVVDKIDAAGGGKAGGPGGSVTVRLRIASDGTLDGAEIEEGSGSAQLDERALRAVRAAAPFRAPPRQILTLEGFTELSFPVQLRGAATR